MQKPLNPVYWEIQYTKSLLFWLLPAANSISQLIAISYTHRHQLFSGHNGNNCQLPWNYIVLSATNALSKRLSCKFQAFTACWICINNHTFYKPLTVDRSLQATKFVNSWHCCKPVVPWLICLETNKVDPVLRQYTVLFELIEHGANLFGWKIIKNARSSPSKWTVKI